MNGAQGPPEPDDGQEKGSAGGADGVPAGGADGGTGNGRGSGAGGGRSGADGTHGGGAVARPPRVPPPRRAPDDAPEALPPPPPPPLGVPLRGHGTPAYDHKVLKSLLGAWALAACSAEETAAIEAHLTDCATCADEALRLRDAVGLLHPEDSLDLDPSLRSRVLEGCLGRRPARIPIPEWAAPYDAEAARLDALLRDMADAEWRAPVRLRWFDGEEEAERETTVAGVIGHLLAVDGLVAMALGLHDPLGAAAPSPSPDVAGPGPGPGVPGVPGLPGFADARGMPGGTGAGDPARTGRGAVAGPTARSEAYWRAEAELLRSSGAVREPWREQGHALIRTVSFAGGGTAGLDVSYGAFTLPLHDAFLDRAFECWVHAGDIAEAVDYPYELPAGEHLNRMVDLAARQLPVTIAGRRRAGLAAPPRRLASAGAPGRTLHLEVEGNGGGHWYIPLDSPAAAPSPEEAVAHVALDGMEFCQLAAGHVPPQEAAAGQDGDREAIRDVLFAAASLSRL